jgi:TIR domain
MDAMPDEEAKQGKQIVEGILERLCVERGATVTSPVSWHYDFDRISYWLTFEIDGRETRWQLSREALTDSVADGNVRKTIERALAMYVIPASSPRLPNASGAHPAALWDDDIIGKAVRPESAKGLIRTITTEFLAHLTGMPAHKAQAVLGSDRGILSSLTMLGILWNGDGIYFPGFCALYFMNTTVRVRIEREVHSFLEFVRDLYSEKGRGPYALRDICADFGNREPIHAGSMIVRAHLARTFNMYFYSFEGSPQTSRVFSASGGPPSVPAISFSPCEAILDYRDLDTAWQTQLKPRFSQIIFASTSGSIAAEVPEAGDNYEWDVFICHASEDKPYVEPLGADLQAAGVRVWFDKTTLQWGDDLRAAIDRGTAACRYGIVVFSKAFLGKKKWTEYELNSLFAREQVDKKLILPIWHNIGRDDLVEYAPALADRFARISTESNTEIVGNFLEILGRPNARAFDGAGTGISAAVGTGSERTKPNAVAYARYETKGQNALRAHAYVRPSGEKNGWFTFENSLGEDEHGTIAEIAHRFAVFDKTLTMQGYIRMQYGNSGDPAFNL